MTLRPTRTPRTDGEHPDLLMADDTIAGLMDFAEFADELSPAFGVVHHQYGEFRWIVTHPPRMWPQRHDDVFGSVVGATLYQTALTRRETLRTLGHRLEIDVQGWLLTGRGSMVTTPWPVPADSASSDSTRQDILAAFYLDQSTGDLLTRWSSPDGRAETGRRERPDDGWNVERDGAVPAALDVFRTAAAI